MTEADIMRDIEWDARNIDLTTGYLYYAKDILYDLKKVSKDPDRMEDWHKRVTNLMFDVINIATEMYRWESGKGYEMGEKEETE